MIIIEVYKNKLDEISNGRWDVTGQRVICKVNHNEINDGTD